MVSSLVRVLCRGALVLVLTATDVGASSAGELVFHIDQRNGTIGFSVNHLGLFTSQGQFDRFTGILHIDPAHPERTMFTIRIDTTSLEASWDGAAVTMRGPNFFDVARYPVMTYTSSAVVPMPRQHYAISGVLEVRGVARPEPLDALLLNRKTDAAHHIEDADFAVSGLLKRSDFGMMTNQVFISDAVTLHIRVRVELPLPPDG
jgi:polyisoprenoid-binding protein YceI